MNDFGSWYNNVYKEDKRLYHEWLVDQMFEPGELTEKQRNKVMLLIHESLLEGMHCGPIIQVGYCQDLTKLVKVPFGPGRGKRISELPNTDETWNICLDLKKKTKDFIVRQACTAKLNEINFQREMRRKESDKRNKRKGRR